VTDNQGAPSQIQIPGLGVSAEALVDEDGRRWVIFGIRHGLVSVEFKVQESEASALCSAVPTVLVEALKRLPKKGPQLILPGLDDIANINGSKLQQKGE
jgi:hypothetical protein